MQKYDSVFYKPFTQADKDSSIPSEKPPPETIMPLEMSPIHDGPPRRLSPPKQCKDYTLRAGDNIQFRAYMTNIPINAIIVEINWCPHADEFNVDTSAIFSPFTSHNSAFQVLETKHADAPPLNTWTWLDDVNLIEGKVSMPDGTRQKSMRKSIDNAAGGREQEAFAEIINIAKTSAKYYKWSQDHSDESEDDDSDDES